MHVVRIQDCMQSPISQLKFDFLSLVYQITVIDFQNCKYVFNVVLRCKSAVIKTFSLLILVIFEKIRIITVKTDLGCDR